MTTLQKWFPYRRSAGGLEVFAVPHIGAATSVFNELRHTLADESVALSATVLAGHGRRIRETPHARMEDLLDEFRAVADADGWAAFQGDYALLGHCSGSLVAFELARILVAAPCADPRLLVVCSCLPPRRIRDTGIARMTTDDLFAYTARAGGTADALIADPDFRQVLEPVLRSDWALVEGYVASGSRIPVPLLAVRGREDPFVDLDDLRAWREHTDRRFVVEELPSGHWALAGDGARALARRIRAVLVDRG